MKAKTLTTGLIMTAVVVSIVLLTVATSGQALLDGFGSATGGGVLQ